MQFTSRDRTRVLDEPRHHDGVKVAAQPIKHTRPIFVFGAGKNQHAPIGVRIGFVDLLKGRKQRFIDGTL